MPNRILKESIRTSKKINSLTDFQFRVWTYLITYVDDYGRGSADPEILKGFVFPRRKRVSESDIHAALAELAGMGCILLYEVDGESYFCFPNWGEHQRIQTKKSKFPEPKEMSDPPYSTVTHGEQPPESESNPNPNTNPNPNPNARASAFEAFWGEYPKKVGKEAAKKAFAKIPPSAFPLLVPAIERQMQSAQWRKDDGQYIPNPATWLNQGRWEDEPPEAEKKTEAFRQPVPGRDDLERMRRLQERMRGGG